MYTYTYDEETGGILLNSTPTNFSKEPRPVYASEMDILGFDQYWDYDHQNEYPYMWAESNVYWYRNKQIAKTRGGDLYTRPELQPIRDENGSVLFGASDGFKLQPIDIEAMCTLNEDLLTVIEDSTVKKIIREYEKFNLSQGDIANLIYKLNGSDDKYDNLEEVTGLGKIDGLGGVNCRHRTYPFIPGISKPHTHIPEDENKPVFKANQQLRGLEREIRKLRKEYAAIKQIGTADEKKAAKQAILKKSDEIDAFCKRHGMKRQFNREIVAEL